MSNFKVKLNHDKINNLLMDCIIRENLTDIGSLSEKIGYSRQWLYQLLAKAKQDRNVRVASLKKLIDYFKTVYGEDFNWLELLKQE